MSDNTVFCRECNAPNQAGSKFCSNCGASLKPATHITCPSCYHRNALNLLYCDNCGTRLVREGAVDDDPASKDDTLELNVPTGFSLPSRNPGDTADLDPDSLPDWLKTGGEGSNTADDNWLDDLKEASTSDLSDLDAKDDDFLALDDDLGGVNLDWLTDDDAEEAAEEEIEDEEAFDFLEDDEPLEEKPQPSPDDDFTLTGIVDSSGSASDFDWLSVMGDVETDEEPAESPPTGFTGLLSPEMLEAFENTADEEPVETTSEEIAELGDWLADQSADDESVLFDDEDDAADDELGEEETTGFTDWLQATTVEDDVQPATAEDIPDWLSPPEEEDEEEPSSAAADDDWLSDLGDDFDTDDDDFTGEEDEPLPDWLETPGTGPLSSDDQSEGIGTGFTGWLNAQHVDDYLAEQEPSETPAEDAAEEFPDWLDTPETGPLPQSEPISTGFTNLLDSSLVDQFEEESEQAEQAEEPAAADDVPDWLSSPPEEEEEGAGTGFTDWLTQSNEAGEADDDEFDEDEDEDDFDWLDQEKTQELMKPLTTEEAEKLLQDTPDVSDDFIKEVVGGDFPEWLTDVETVEDPGDTGVLPAWISAPVSESDTLTLGLGRDMPLPTGDDDDWLADLAGAKPGEDDNDWFSELATSTAAADEDLFAGGDDDDDSFDDDFLDELAPDGSDFESLDFEGDEFDDDLFTEPATADDESTEGEAWLEDLPALEEGDASAGDDWLAGMPGLEDEPSASTEDNWLAGMPDMDNTGEILDDVFGDMPEKSGSGDEDWLADMPDQGEEQDTEGWMSSFGELGSKATASLDWMDELAEDEEDEDEDELELLGGEEGSEAPRDPTFIDPVLDFENFEAISEDTNAGELDWLSVIESTSADNVVEESGDEENPEAWLTGSDLDQEESGSYILDENLHAVVFKEDEEDDYPSSDDTDTLGDNWEVDLLAPIAEDDTDIMQELRALRSTDRLDPEVVEAVRQDEEDPEIAEFISNREESLPRPRTSPDWITDGDDTLTNWVVDPFEREEPAVQKGGPLDGLSGVVTIAPVMAVAPTIARGTAATQLQVSPEHQQHASLLRQLARGSWEAPPPAAVKEAQPTAGDRSALLLRLALGLLLIIALVVGILMPTLLPTSALPTTPELRQVNTVLNELNNQSVLVAFEYSPSFAGELNPQAQLFLSELAQNGNRVILMSQYPTGLANVRPLVASIDNLEATEIGYIPGEALGLREIASCLNQPSCQTAAGQMIELGQVDALIVLTGERDSLINWVEQVEARTTIPMLLGVTEALAPMAQPYVVSDQVDGVVAGLPAAATYEQAYQVEGSSGRLFQAQTLARILAVAVIIIGAGVALLPKKSADTK